MTRRWKSVGAWLLLLSAITLIGIFVGRQFYGMDEHRRYSTTIRSLCERSESLNANILRLRFGFLQNYDPLVEDIRQIKLLNLELENIPSFIRQQASLRELVTSQRQILADIETTLENLKTNNATLNNSLRFFPEHASQIASELQSRGDDAVAAELNDLVRKILLLNIGAADITAASLQESLDRLTKKHQESRLEQELFTLGVHARAIVAAKPDVDTAVRHLLNSSLQGMNNRLLDAYSSAYDLETKKDRVYWLCLIPITLLLVLSLVLVFRKLNKSRDALSSLNLNLEERIKHRTVELECRNASLKEEIQERHRAESELKAFSAQLEHRNRELKETQGQLVQAQKLEAIGQLAAGIAHEINTPTQYIGDNVRFLKDAFVSLQGVLADFDVLLKAAHAQATLREQVSSVEKKLLQADMEFLSDEIPQAIEQTLEGVGRVSRIVSAMKEFSHPGIKEKSGTDLNRAIQTTLTIAHNEYKYVAEAVVQYDKDLPYVPVLIGEFNQVILNLVVNAAHAIGDKLKAADSGKGARGTITVQTLRDGDYVVVRIGDTGTGIPESIRNRIFDPFFTTKEVGKGSGQGLAIARSTIVDKHGGTLSFETENGKGTTFIVRLPISPVVSRKSAAIAV